MAGWRRAFELALGQEDCEEIKRGRRVCGRSWQAGSNGRECCSPAGKIHPLIAVGRALGVRHQTVERLR